MPQKQPTDPQLSELENVSDDEFGNAAEIAEGGKEKTRASEPNGGQFAPEYSIRRTRCYTVTDSELRQIGLANMAATSFFTIGSLLAGFAIDIFKDLVLTGEVPAAAQQIIDSAQPILFTMAGVFYLIGIAAMLWRWDMIRAIKAESAEEKTDGKWRIQWPITRSKSDP